MIKSNRNVNLLIALIILSLVGLIIIQGYLLKDAVDSREQTFNHNVAAALTRANELIEAHQTLSMIISVSSNGNRFDSMSVSIIKDDSTLQDTVESQLYIYKGENVISHKGISDSIVLDKIRGDLKTDSIALVARADCDSILVKQHRYLKGSYDENDSTIIGIMTSSSSNKADFIEKVLDQMWVSEIVPIEDRLDSALIDSSIGQALTEANIYLDYAFGVSTAGRDTLLYAPAEYKERLPESSYRINLFPLDIISEKAELLLYFPDRQAYLWQQILPMLLTIGIFILVIVITFIYTINVIINQKRNQTMIADFINNMTHEFKTPISTIALATEAILRKDMISDSEKVAQFSNMIRDENKRMRQQAEKILHLASMENGEVKLKLDEVDIHQVIKEAVDNISLSIAKLDGKIKFENKADYHSIMADKIHMAGIISNLLDNAVKYSDDKPEINVLTVNADNGIYIRVSDNGIGISKSDLKLVFNKYYRVSSGNVHNVKGFGLGLSYVKLMTEAHGGKVEIKSQPGKGTRVELYFPLEKK